MYKSDHQTFSNYQFHRKKTEESRDFGLSPHVFLVHPHKCDIYRLDFLPSVNQWILWINTDVVIAVCFRTTYTGSHHSSFASFSLLRKQEVLHILHLPCHYTSIVATSCINYLMYTKTYSVHVLLLPTFCSTRLTKAWNHCSQRSVGQIRSKDSEQCVVQGDSLYPLSPPLSPFSSLKLVSTFLCFTTLIHS